MAKSSKDIQLSELKDMISQLNTTIRTLNDTIVRQQEENDNLKAELAWLNITVRRSRQSGVARATCPD